MLDAAGSSQLQKAPKLDQTEPMIQTGDPSVIAFLRKGKRMLCRSCEREEKEVNSPTDTNVNEEGGRGGTSSARAEILLQPMEKIIVTQACGGKHTGAGFLSGAVAM